MASKDRPKSSICIVGRHVPLISMDDRSTETTWRVAVRQALQRGDDQALAALFTDAQDMWGSDHASRMWLEEVSGFDASAVTG